MAQSVSAEFSSTSRTKSHTTRCKIEWLDPTTLAVKQDLSAALLDGSITIQAGTEARRTCSLTIANAAGVYTPLATDTANTAAFALNSVIRVWKGLVKADGTTEWVAQGTFLVDKPKPAVAAGERALHVELTDFWKKMKYGALDANAHYAAGSSIAGIFADLFTRAKMFNFNIDAAFNSITLAPAPAADLNFRRGMKFADIFALFAKDYAVDFYMDPLGVPNAHPAPDFSGAAVLAIADTDPWFLGISGGFEDSPDIANHVFVSSANPDVPPLVAEARDDQVSSPTYYAGPFGDRIIEYESNWVQSDGQGQAAAFNILRRSLFRVRPYDLRGLPLVWLEADDIVTLTSADEKLTAARFRIDSMTIPLRAAEATYSVQEIRGLGLQ